MLRYGFFCLKLHPLAKAVLTVLSIPYKVRYAPVNSDLSRSCHLRHSTLVVEERGPIQEERDRFGRGDALLVQVPIRRSFPYEDSDRKGAVRDYNDDTPGCSHLHRYLSEEEPVQ